MTFSMQCLNKDCRKFTTPLLDEETDQVVCGDCFKEIPNITIHVKNQLRGSRQIKKKTKAAKAFAIQCKWCQSNDVPEAKNNKLYCTNCQKDMECPQAFVNLFNMKKAKAL